MIEIMKHISNIRKEELKFANSLDTFLKESFPDIVNAYNLLVKNNIDKSTNLEEFVVYHDDNIMYLSNDMYTYSIIVTNDEVKKIVYTINEGVTPHWSFDKGFGLYGIGVNVIKDEYNYDGMTTFHSSPVIVTMLYGINEIMEMYK